MSKIWIADIKKPEEPDVVEMELSVSEAFALLAALSPFAGAEWGDGKPEVGMPTKQLHWLYYSLEDVLARFDE